MTVMATLQAAAKELAVDKITVNAYNPGIVRTKMRDAIDKKIAKIKHETITQQHANCLKEIALGREAKPSYVAEVVAWFASSGAGYVTGQSLQVDDGMRFH